MLGRAGLGGALIACILPCKPDCGGAWYVRVAVRLARRERLAHLRGTGAADREVDLPRRRDRRGERPGAVSDLPAAHAAGLARAGDLPRRRRVGAGERAQPQDPARRGDHDRLPRHRADPDRHRRGARAAGRRADGQARQQPARVHAGPQQGLRRERAAQAAQRGLRHHGEARRRRRRPRRQARRGGGHAGRHRRRPGQLDLRAGDDPRDEHVHGRARQGLARGVPAHATARAGRGDPARDRPHRQRGQRLHRRARSPRPSSPASSPS